MAKLIRFDDKDPSEADLETYEIVVEIARRLEVDPSMSSEAEEFFSILLREYEGDSEGLPVWVQDQILHHFLSLSQRPRWLQNPEWPLANGRPMIFVGQIDITNSGVELISHNLHDTTSFYVFIGEKVPPVVIMQQM